MAEKVTNARVSPEGSLEILSRHEVDLLKDKGEGGLYRLFRQCALAVLNCGNESDDAEEIMDTFQDFDIRLVQQPRGLKVELLNAPASAFVDGVMIRGIREHLFSVLRDIVYSRSLVQGQAVDAVPAPEDTTNMIFHVLRNADVLSAGTQPNTIVCWGGHSISREEYVYSKKVGHELGLRGLNICTGCGPGAMKGPMKGATIAHAKQRIHKGRYLGITEPGIIAAESPNPIVNKLVILPDIEKRLEAFVRAGHGIVIFPGGVGTAEEILYILGILLHPENRELPFPLVFSGSAANADYFEMMDSFIRAALGDEAASRYKIIIDNPQEVAREMKAGMELVRNFRRQKQDAYYFNWLLKIDPIFQQPFEPTHDSMLALNLSRDQPPHLLAANLRCAFSGIVAGNVKEHGVAQVKQKGPFEISGDSDLLGPLGVLLDTFVKQNRMKLPGQAYRPSYRIVPKKSAKPA